MYVLDRSECPACGSSDNLITWDDNHQYCFTPNCTFNKGQVSRHTPPIKPKKLRSISLNKRRLTANTCSKYGVGAYNGCIYFPYYRGNQIQGYKVRNPSVPKKDKKHFWVEGTITNILFGNQCVHNKNVVAICTGEYDAMSIYQMTNVSGLSLSSDSVATKAIETNLEWLESFEKIILCVDNDTSGQKAGEIIKEIIRPYQLFHMVFPTGFKDASQMLMESQTELFTRAFWSARPTPIKTIFTFEELSKDLTSNYEVPKGIETGIPILDKHLGGLRPGELTTVLAKTYQGKSTFSRILFSNLIRSKVRCLLNALEEEPRKYTRRLLHTYAGRPIIELTTEERTFLVNEMLRYLIVSKLNGKVQPKALSDVIEYAVRRDKVQCVLVDNLSAAVDRSRLFEQTSLLVETLFGLCKDFGVHIVSVCHIHRDGKSSDQEPLESGYGSSAIEHASDNMIVINRTNSEERKVQIALVKNRELGKLTTFTTTFNPRTGRYNDKTTKAAKDEQSRNGYSFQLPGRESIITL